MFSIAPPLSVEKTMTLFSYIPVEKEKTSGRPIYLSSYVPLVVRVAITPLQRQKDLRSLKRVSEISLGYIVFVLPILQAGRFK